jgi:ribosomal protein S18 acetylase RimI-like enzyme
MSTIEIKKVHAAGIALVMEIIRDAVQDMEAHGIHQWDEIYPGRTVFSADIAAGNLYGLWLDGSLAGIVVLNEDQSSEYQAVVWQDNGHPLVIHRLCIKPAFQGQGLARMLVMFAEEFARRHRFTSIRLDAFQQNPDALKLYDSLRYQRRGLVIFRRGPFFCYEKVL